MKQRETNIVREKSRLKALPGNIKLVSGKSLDEKFQHAKAVSATIKSFKK